MGAMRTILLWMARNPWLKDRIPRLGFVRRAVRRFMPGESPDVAFDAAEAFGREGIGTLFTRLGENLTDRRQADEVAGHYLGVLDVVETRGIDGEISVKPTQLGMDLDPELTFEHCVRLATRAEEVGGELWLDMEGSDYVEATVRLYERLKRNHPNVGICLQAYLHRTADDVQRLLPLSPSIRLVKGAYDEPASIAYRGRRAVDANYLALAVTLLEASRSGRVRLGLGTHDVRLIEQVAEHARALGLPRTTFEIQMLYGIRLDQQRRLASEGYVVRDLIAYGTAWYPWYMRRLAERPANVLFALRQLLP
jgi:proline dehydrogenase